MNKMRKQLITLLLAAVLLIEQMPVTAAAYDGRYDVDWSKVTAAAPGERAAQIAWTQVGYFENTHPDGMSGTVMAQSGSNPSHYYNKYSGSRGEWCVAFVWWCLQTSGIRENAIPRSKHVSVITQQSPTGLYTYYPCGSGYEPKVGDIVVYGWDGGEAAHAELVVGVQVTNSGSRNPADRAIQITSVGGNTTGVYEGQKCKWGVGVHNTFLYYPNRQAQSDGDRILGVAGVHYEAFQHDHSEIIQAERLPTCTKSGLTQGKYCSDCRQVLQAQKTVSAKGHRYVNGFCGACGLKEGVPSSEQSVTNPFWDVTEHNFFYSPVLWAVSNGITNGTGAATFSPDTFCTRSQVVTFLWRSMGSPKPVGNECPFTDVPKDAYYYNAVLWAMERGITGGTTATSFSPDDPCTRAQVVTFLWRAFGRPAVVNGAYSFTDVPADAYYSQAVLWAVDKGVTNGVGNGRFAPDATCNRGQVVSFLYRALR